MPTVPTAPWDRVYADTKIAIPAVTDAVFQQVLFQVVKDFYEQTNLWQETVPIAVQPNVLSYHFTLSHKGKPNRLLLLYDPARADPDKKWVQGNVMMQVPGTITIAYSPSTAATWNAIIAKTCGDPTNVQNYPDLEAPDFWTIDKYRDGIVAGVLSRLMLLPAKPFSNLKLAKWYRQTYVVERGKARADGIKANVFGGQRWVFPQDFATTTRKGWT